MRKVIALVLYMIMILVPFACKGKQGPSGPAGVPVTVYVIETSPTATATYPPGTITFTPTATMTITPTHTSTPTSVATVYCMIDTYAGNGGGSYSGDGGAALSAGIMTPLDIDIDRYGNLYVCGWTEARVRKVDTMGVITTIAGMGVTAYSGDGGPATLAGLRPSGIAVDDFGNVFISDNPSNRIRKIDLAGNITTYAGNGNAEYTGDGGSATAAGLNDPCGLAIDSLGNLYVADRSNHAIRKISTSGIITTVVGTGSAGSAGDGGLATSATINTPVDVFVDDSNNLYLTVANKVRKVSASGIISTVAGAGASGFSGDNGLATSATLTGAAGVCVDSRGNIYIGDRVNNRVRRVNEAGIIGTIAGNGIYAYSGDGGLATAAELKYPWGVVVDAYGSVYVADSDNGRVRKLAYCN